MIVILLYFILGIIFIQICSPILDSLTSLILTMIEVIKGYFSIKIARYNLQVKKDYAKEEKTMPLIGFEREEEEEEYEI